MPRPDLMAHSHGPGVQTLLLKEIARLDFVLQQGFKPVPLKKKVGTRLPTVQIKEFVMAAGVFLAQGKFGRGTRQMKTSPARVRTLVDPVGRIVLDAGSA